MAKVSIENIRKQFGAAVAVSDFSLEIAEGELVAFLGPSGCGKTTTLRMIAGFITPTAGRIRIGEPMSPACPCTSAIPAWCSNAMRCFRT